MVEGTVSQGGPDERGTTRSTVKRLVVFPEGRAAENVLAVDLDDDTAEYLSAYPGTAQWLSDYAAEKLSLDLSEVGMLKTEVPGLGTVLCGEPDDFKGFLEAWAFLWVPWAGVIAFMVVNVGLGGRWPWIAGGVGLATMLLVGILMKKNKWSRQARDQEKKQVYDDRLRNSADHLIFIDDSDADDVREVIALIDTINGNLAQVKNYGFSTREESGLIEESLTTYLRAHIDARSAQPQLERFAAVLRDVTSETIAADTDLQNVQQLKEELSTTIEAAGQQARGAKNEIHQLEKRTTAAVRQAEAKFQAAELRAQRAERGSGA
jgi:hypothetical protein